MGQSTAMTSTVPWGRTASTVRMTAVAVPPTVREPGGAVWGDLYLRPERGDQKCHRWEHVGDPCGLRPFSVFTLLTELEKCSVFGDPYYHTFDGFSYHFLGRMNYYLVKTVEELPHGVEPLVMEGRNKVSHRGIPALHEVTTIIYDYKIQLQEGLVVLVSQRLDQPRRNSGDGHRPAGLGKAHVAPVQEVRDRERGPRLGGAGERSVSGVACSRVKLEHAQSVKLEHAQ